MFKQKCMGGVSGPLVGVRRRSPWAGPDWLWFWFRGRHGPIMGVFWAGSPRPLADLLKGCKPASLPFKASWGPEGVEIWLKNNLFF